MTPKLAGSLAAVALAPILLGACVTGLPWGHRNDANAAQAVDRAAPLIAQCRQQFQADLGGKANEVESGPTLVNDGDVTTIRLDAMLRDQPSAAFAKTYSCEFDHGKLSVHGLTE
jgi:hypothetical protein